MNLLWFIMLRVMCCQRIWYIFFRFCKSIYIFLFRPINSCLIANRHIVRRHWLAISRTALEDITFCFTLRNVIQHTLSCKHTVKLCRFEAISYFNDSRVFYPSNRLSKKMNMNMNMPMTTASPMNGSMDHNMNMGHMMVSLAAKN